MVLNAAVQMLREADELKQKILKFKSGTSMLQERSLWVTQQQLQKVYQKVLVLDLDYALDKKVEQDLWNIGFKQQIEALQAISKDRKNPLRSEGQAMLSWVLQAAAGFYLCLLHQICTTFKLDLPFRRRASLLGFVEGWGAGEAASGARVPPPGAAKYICQHCLVHLGDLARYRQQLRQAHTFYRHALVLSAHSGQPYNQLALVAWRRGRRLGALYWHVRSLLVRAPFPPAPGNLARTLHAATISTQPKDLPVLPGFTPRDAQTTATPQRLDAQSYVAELIRAIHLIHTVDDLDTAATIVNNLNSSLTVLVATDSFESMTLIKMACVLIWLIHSATEDFKLQSPALSSCEARATSLAYALCSSSVLALSLPAYSSPAPPRKSCLPALKVWASWLTGQPAALQADAWSARPALWPALAHTLTLLADNHLDNNTYDTVPLPEDEELHGFLPLEASFKGLRFANYACWDTYGGRLPDLDAQVDDQPAEVSPTCLSNEPELEHRLRARRLVLLGRRLADLTPDHISYTEEEGVITFTAASVGGEQLSQALAELSLAPPVDDPAEDLERDSDDEPVPPPPIVISEADFREKVREKRVGILKPQGSLERAREERALASTQDDQEPENIEEGSKTEDKKEVRKPRVNIAMAAIMRKQEETNKQVKFVTPPPTPDSTADAADNKEEKPKVIQPKPMKSLANLPIGRKTGGILSLKDKSAGYPHLVNTDPEPKKEKEEKKEQKPQGPSQNSQQNYQQKRQEPNQQPNWGPTNQQFNEPRMNFQKNYGIQNAGISYNPSYQPPSMGNNIRLPVVNPKEIDVRTAALQKQNSRPEMFQDGHKFGNHNYQMSGDKKNFLNDLPPRFANQYRYWQSPQESQFPENKFRDDSFKNQSLFNNQQPNWNNPPPENYQSPTWWKPEQPFNASNFTTPPMNVQANYSPYMSSNMGYQNMPAYNPSQGMGQSKESMMGQNYLQSTIGQPQLQTLQNLVTSPNFNSSLNSFSSYPTVGYDSSMYPQFSNKLGYQPLPVPKPQTFQGGKELDMNLGFGANMMEMQQRNLSFNDPLSADGAMKNLDQIGNRGEPAPGAGNTYSLFSGAPDNAAWGAAHHLPHQSLWSGPGPSPLERLLEQQKLIKQPPPPQ